MFQIVLIYFILREVACLFYYDVDKDALNVKHRVLRAGRNDKGQNNAIVEIATSKNMVDKLALLRLGCKAIAYDVPALIFMIYLCTQYEYDSVGFSMLGITVGQYILRRLPEEYYDLANRLITCVMLGLYFYLFVY